MNSLRDRSLLPNLIRNRRSSTGFLLYVSADGIGTRGGFERLGGSELGVTGLAQL